MKNKVTPLKNLDDPYVINKILNPNQRQLLEDSRRFKEQMNQLREGMRSDDVRHIEILRP